MAGTDDVMGSNDERALLLEAPSQQNIDQMINDYNDFLREYQGLKSQIKALYGQSPQAFEGVDASLHEFSLKKRQVEFFIKNSDATIKSFSNFTTGLSFLYLLSNIALLIFNLPIGAALLARKAYSMLLWQGALSGLHSGKELNDKKNQKKLIVKIEEQLASVSKNKNILFYVSSQPLEKIIDNESIFSKQARVLNNIVSPDVQFSEKDKKNIADSLELLKEHVHGLKYLATKLQIEGKGQNELAKSVEELIGAYHSLANKILKMYSSHRNKLTFSAVFLTAHTLLNVIASCVNFTLLGIATASCPIYFIASAALFAVLTVATVISICLIQKRISAFKAISSLDCTAEQSPSALTTSFFPTRKGDNKQERGTGVDADDADDVDAESSLSPSELRHALLTYNKSGA